MEMPLPVEQPVLEGVDHARVGLDAPPKPPLQSGASPSADAARAPGGIVCAFEFSFHAGLCPFLILIGLVFLV